MVGRKGTGKKKFPICALLAVLCIAALSGWIWFTWEKIPASIRIKAGVSQELSFNVPVSGEVYLSLDEQKEAVPAAGMQMETVGKEQSLHVDLSRPVTMMASRTQSYKMDVRLFGVIPFKTVDVQVIPDKMLIPAGIPIGIYVKTDGVMVIAQGEFEGIDHSVKEPARHLLMAGDYILKADGQELTSKQELTEKIASGGGAEMVLTIRRDGEVFDIRVKPQQDAAGEYKLGIWIRDNAQGVGTMTYLEEVLGSAFVVFPNDELYDEVWDSYMTYVQNSAKITAKHCLFLMTYLLGQEKDVLFVQCAGNGWKGNTVGKEQAMDAVCTGFFASVTQAVFDEVCRTQEDNQAEDLEEYRMWGKFPYSEFKSRILVVGAVCRETDENGNYRMADFSNYGVSVDICAPGTDLKTASVSGGYVTGVQGTSFAAPMVAGAAAFLKSIDEDLTAGEIRELLLKNTDREAFLKDNKTGIKPVLNIGMAVEALLSQEGIMIQPQGNEEHDKLLESKLEGLIAEYGVISTGTREYLAETLNATQLSVPSGELTGVLGGDIYDYDGDGETELMAAVLETRTQGTDGTKTGGTVCRICIYEATEEGAQLADECSISMSGLDSWMDASWQLARGRDLQGRTVLYADAYYSMNDLFFSVVSLCYEDGRLLPKRGVQCAETGAGCACYILSDGAGIEGGNLVGAQGGWTEQVFYPWENAWLESGGPDPEQARSFRMVYEENLKQVGLADANPRGRMMAEEYPEIGAFSGENREEFQRQVQAQEDFYYDCCVRRMDEHFSMADGSALTPLCGVLSPRYRDPDTGRVGIRLTCYDTYRDGR